MEAIIRIENRESYESLIRFLRSLDIEVNEKMEKQDVTTTMVKSKSGLDDVFGMWKGRNITLDKIRQKQWGKRAGQ